MERYSHLTDNAFRSAKNFVIFFLILLCFTGTLYAAPDLLPSGSSAELDLSTVPLTMHLSDSETGRQYNYNLLSEAAAIIDGSGSVSFKTKPVGTVTQDGITKACRTDSENGIAVRIKSLEYKTIGSLFDNSEDYDWETDTLHTRDTDSSGRKRGQALYEVTYELYDTDSGAVYDTKSILIDIF